MIEELKAASELERRATLQKSTPALQQAVQAGVGVVAGAGVVAMVGEGGEAAGAKAGTITVAEAEAGDVSTEAETETGLPFAILQAKVGS